MIEYISQPWPWYFSGPLITLIMFLLLWSGGYFGVSSNLRSFCAIGGAGKKVAFFRFRLERTDMEFSFHLRRFDWGVHRYKFSQ